MPGQEIKLGENETGDKRTNRRGHNFQCAALHQADIVPPIGYPCHYPRATTRVPYSLIHRNRLDLSLCSQH